MTFERVEQRPNKKSIFVCKKSKKHANNLNSIFRYGKKEKVIFHFKMGFKKQKQK